MKKIHCFFAALLCLCSCSNFAHYAVLEQADSLMNNNIDSAYTLIKSLNPKDLSTKYNAYYSLLLTTAQYKKVVPIKNDSVIDIAIKYYTDHFDQDKLTRALMYKGAVLADLNFNKQALASYKEAEKLADTTDYLTMGLLNFRMGELYQKSFIDNDEHLNRYKKALDFFKKSNHHAFENYTMIPLGQLYILRDFDSAEYYLKQAIFLAEERKDKLTHINGLATLARLYKHYNIKTNEAVDILSTVYQESDSKPIRQSVISDIAILYSKLGNIDSANYFYKQCPLPVTSLDSMRYYMMQEELALAKNDYKTAYSSQKRANKIADIIVKLGKSEEYYAIDKEFDNQIANSKVEQLTIQRKLHISLIVIISLSFLIVILIGVYFWRRKKRILLQNQQLVDNLQMELLNQQTLTKDILEKNVLSISNLNKTIHEKEELENSLKEIVSNRMLVLRNIMNIKYQFGDKPETFIQQFDKIIAINKKSQKECDSIISIANRLYNNIIDYTDNEYYGLLSYGDKLMLSLVCLEFSPLEMTVFLNCPNTTAMYSQRYRLGKKLKISSLEVYIANVKMALFMSKKLEKSIQEQ